MFDFDTLNGPEKPSAPTTEPPPQPQERPALTKEKAMALLMSLHRGYSEENFQVKLRQVYVTLNRPRFEFEFRKAKLDLMLTVQSEILPKYGFEGSTRGINDMNEELSTFKDESDIQYMNDQIADVLQVRVITPADTPPRSPELGPSVPPPMRSSFRGQASEQKPLVAGANVTPSTATPSGSVKSSPVLGPSTPLVLGPGIAGDDFVEVDLSDGYWIVVGGQTSGGIVARMDADRHSKTLAQKLAYNSIVEEMERKDGRLHYRKVVGEGPDFGWVSLKNHNKSLLEHYAGPLPSASTGIS